MRDLCFEKETGGRCVCLFAGFDVVGDCTFCVENVFGGRRNMSRRLPANRRMIVFDSKTWMLTASVGLHEVDIW